MQLTVPVLVHPQLPAPAGIAAGDRSGQAARSISPLPPSLEKRRLWLTNQREAQLDGRPDPVGVGGDDVGELTGNPKSDAATAGGVGVVVAGGREYRSRAGIVDANPGRATV
jgi:hypothetical protein